MPEVGKFLRAGLWLVVVAGLAIDAYVHFHLASSYRLVRTTSVSQADLFRLEASVAVMAIVLVLVRRSRLVAALTLIVSGAGAAAVVFYASVDPGALGPLPDMYEPVWFAEKTLSVVAEVAAAAASLLLLVLPVGRRLGVH